MHDPLLDAAHAIVPTAVRKAIVAHVHAEQQTEVLLDIADRIAALMTTNDHASVAAYLSEVLASLSMDHRDLY
jgi:hypothetical protein